ncbi:hypothetical protein Lokhon_01044 [Limimaricola hongkongensis DSM 17492]|uniref:Uncharacterized protein n=1 Tax=Limimaricola hongkongensis DSM 17492 TaxID=1122180 RepID=A0A017HCZ5_9RHOB|nr:hypothetical protein Lokhon_01044 [Limimaricola hongkongensis DSM 17492]
MSVARGRPRRRMEIRPLRAWLWHDPFAMRLAMQDISPNDRATARPPGFRNVTHPAQPSGGSGAAFERMMRAQHPRRQLRVSRPACRA